MGTYRLTKRADTDLASLYRYGIRNFGIERADKYFDSLLATLEEIGNSPMQFQQSDYRKGYRRCVHHPHTVYFRVMDPETVEIVRILRGQDPRRVL